MRTKLALLILLAVFGVVWVFGESAPERADLTLHFPALETLDGQRATASFDVRVSYALFEGLLAFNPYTFEVIPGVAESYTVSPDNLTYTFTLRKNARWSNGDPVTTADFLEAWYQAHLPGVAMKYQEFFYHIKGSKKFIEWCNRTTKAINELESHEEKWQAANERYDQSREKFAEIVAVEADGPYKMSVTLERPLPYFVHLVASWPYFPLHARAIRKELNVSPDNYMILRNWTWTRPDTMITNGPYKLAKWRFKRDVLLTKNAYFWKADLVGPQTIRFVHITQNNTAYYAYEQGQLDICYETVVEFRPELVEKAREGKRKDVHEISSFGTYFYGFNCRPKLADGSPNPVADPRIRKALAMSVDRKELVENVTRMYQRPTTCFIPHQSIHGYENVEGLKYDPQAARQVLAEAGYPDGKGLPVIEIFYNTGQGHELQAQAIAAMWEKHLGISVSLKGQEWKVFQETRNSGKFVVCRHGWFGDYVDPTTFLDMFKQDSGMNDFGLKDPKYDALMEKAAATYDPAQRMAILQEAERYVLNEVVAILPLYEYKVVHLFDPEKLKIGTPESQTGMSFHPRNLQMFYLWRVKR